MSKNKSLASGARKSRRGRTLLWIVVVVAVIITLIVKERIAELYVLSTLSVVALLSIVAWSNLGQSRRPSVEPAPYDDSAALADGLGAQNVAPAAASGAGRGARGRRRG